MAPSNELIPSFKDLYAPATGPQKTCSRQAFLNCCEHYIRIDIDCRHIDNERPHELVDALLKSAENLCEIVSNGPLEGSHETSVALWPTLLVTDEGDAKISWKAQQDRGTILIGIEVHGDGDYDAQGVSEAIQSWDNDFRTTQLFYDYEPKPTFRTYLVDRSLLGSLVVDHIMYAQLASNKMIVWESWAHGEALERPNVWSVDIEIDTSPTRGLNADESLGVGSSAAAAAARCFPSPPRSAKRLTPAEEIRNRLIYDDQFEASQFVIVYEDRLTGLAECPVEAWQTESTAETFIPQHRIRAFKKISNGRVVWHRVARIDLMEDARKEASAADGLHGSADSVSQRVWNIKQLHSLASAY